MLRSPAEIVRLDLPAPIDEASFDGHAFEAR
jgi:hypothetical protein